MLSRDGLKLENNNFSNIFKSLFILCQSSTTFPFTSLVCFSGSFVSNNLAKSLASEMQANPFPGQGCPPEK